MIAWNFYWFFTKDSARFILMLALIDHSVTAKKGSVKSERNIDNSTETRIHCIARIGDTAQKYDIQYVEKYIILNALRRDAFSYLALKLICFFPAVGKCSKRVRAKT